MRYAAIKNGYVFPFGLIAYGTLGSVYRRTVKEPFIHIVRIGAYGTLTRIAYRNWEAKLVQLNNPRVF